MKMGLLSTGTFLTMPAGRVYGRVSASFDEELRSPYLKPFVDRLPTLHELTDGGKSLTRVPTPRLEDITRYARPYVGLGAEGTGLGPDATEFYEIAVVERSVKFHHDLPETPVWAYVDANNRPSSSSNPKRLLSFSFPRIELGQGEKEGMLVRLHNELKTLDKSPIDPTRDFGFPTLTMHFHGGHQPSAADGFPHDIENGGGPDFPNLPAEHVTVHQGRFFDYMFPFRDVGFVDSPETRDERPSFYWFHDHILDFTGPNVYRGLANLAPAFDRLDSGDETDTREDPETGRKALGLPSGPYDIPMVFQDKIFDVSGAIIFDPFNGDGFLGDTMLVNGVVQPYHVVERRKYRLRFLNGSNARIYQMFLTNDSGQSFPMTQIATEGGLLANSINIRSFELYMAQRVEVIVDFAHSMFDGQKYVYIENRMRQDDGRKPDGVESRGTKLLQFRLGERVTDPSSMPATLRPFDAISKTELDNAQHRTFKFDRSGGVFTINGEPIDIDRADRVPRNVGQIWHFENSSGGWWHPNHVHSEFMRVLARNGRRLTPDHPAFAIEGDGQARKDTVVMRNNESIDVYIKFRDFSGPFVFHCHNMEHEDHAMMARFDVE